jgi:hypothetical protein
MEHTDRSSRKHKNTELSSKIQNIATSSRALAIIGIVFMFAALGSFFITQSKAATLTVAQEAEQGTLSGNSVRRTGQNGASGAAAVEFNVGSNTGGNTGVDTPNNTGPNGITGNFRIAFGDDFKGTDLDNTKWIRCNMSFNSSCVPFNHELQKFNASLTNNDNIVVSGGQLHLVANQKNTGIWSGTVSTAPKGAQKFGYNQPGYTGFEYTYGVYEARVKFPKGDGFWPSLWALPDQQKYGGWPSSGEYDVVEVNGTHPSQGHFTVHKSGNSCGPSDCAHNDPELGDMTTDYHTFALDWQPDSLTWYYDGRQVHKVTDKAYIRDYPFYLIANFSMCPQNTNEAGGGGCWGGQTGGVNGSTPFPSSMDIDYMRVWQRQ